MENAEAAIELENDDENTTTLRAVVTGWKSNHLADFLAVRLEEQKNEDGSAVMAADGAYTAEIQTCSG